MLQGIAFFVSVIVRPGLQPFPAHADDGRMKRCACDGMLHAHTPRYRQSGGFARIIAA